MCTRPTARRDSGFRLPATAARSSPGFTLLEVIIALALIAIVVGGVYSVAGATIGLGKSMSEARVGETRVTNFVSQWREHLETLAPGTVFSAGEKIRFENGNIPFAWHRLTRRADAVEFDLKKKELVVRHLKRPKGAAFAGEYRVLAEMPLLQGLRTFRCQYYDPQEKKWHGGWDPKKRPQAPLFMRMKFGFEGERNDYEYTFWVANDIVTSQVALANPPAAPPTDAPPQN